MHLPKHLPPGRFAPYVEPMLRALILSERYPDDERPNFGKFVQRQMVELAAVPGVNIEVVAPLRVTTENAWLSKLPLEEVHHGLRVYRPRYAGERHLRARALSAALLPLVTKIREHYPFDLVSAEFAWPEGPAAVAIGTALNVPVSIKARGADFELRLGQLESRRHLLAAAHAARGLLAVSNDVKRMMVEAGLGPGEITVHYPAVDLDRFRPADKSEAKAALSLAGPILLTVGNLSGTKGQRLAVEALAQLPDATLLIIGSGPEESALRERVDQLGLKSRVKMFGSLPHEILPAFYAAADLMLHLPEVEGFGNVRLEALACGTPLVTTAPGDAERLIRTQEAGRIVPADASAVAQAVRDLLASPRRPDVVRSVAGEFTWERSTRQLEAYFRKLVGR